MPPLLVTERLAFHPFTLNDLGVLASLHDDPEIMRYLSPEGRPWSAAELQGKIERFVHEQDTLGFSKWKVCAHVDGAVIGRAGFSTFRPTAELELGFILRRDAWGKGYASECAQGLVNWLFKGRPDIGHIIAFAHVENLASQRVIQKIGMIPTGIRLLEGTECAFYRLDRRRWAAHSFRP